MIPHCYFRLFRDDDGKAWVTFKQQGQLGIHAKINSEGKSKDGECYNISCDDDEFNLNEIKHNSFIISHTKAKDLSFKIIRPEMVFSSIHSKNVSNILSLILPLEGRVVKYIKFE